MHYASKQHGFFKITALVVGYFTFHCLFISCFMLYRIELNSNPQDQQEINVKSLGYKSSIRFNLTSRVTLTVAPSKLVFL